MNKKLLSKAFGYQVAFAVLVLIATVIFMPTFLDQVAILNTELQGFQSGIPQIDPNDPAQVEQLQQGISDIDALVAARNTVLLYSSIYFIVLVLLSSLIFTLQRKLFVKRQSFKKTFGIILAAQVVLFIFSFVFLAIASFIAASLGLIETNTSLFAAVGILGILYSYMFILAYVQKKSLIKKALRIHTIFVFISILYAILVYQVIPKAFAGSLFFIFLAIILLIGGYAIAAYEKYLLFEKYL